MEEIWKDIEGYEGAYQISNMGRVKSLSRKVRCRGGFRTVPERILKLNKKRDGYLNVELRKNAKGKWPPVHRLVGNAFIPKKDGLNQINHIDGNKENNTVSNLEWCNQSQNQLHAYKNKLQVPLKGSEVPHSKLKEQDIYDIKELYQKGLSKVCIAKKYNVTDCHIGRIIRGERWGWLDV